jgi:pyridoxal biosynthesis lyase PdxS
MENMSMENNIPFRLYGTPAEAVAEFLAEAARRIENQAAFIKSSNKGSATSIEMAKAGREVAAILRGIVIEEKKAP